MHTLQQLIHDPQTTVADIFAAGAEPVAIANAEAVVRADLAGAADAVDAAINTAQESIERYLETNKPPAGQMLVGEAALEVREKLEQAWEALSAARDARQRYRPWRIAVERLMQPQISAESNGESRERH